ncbi:MAG: HAD-IIA family hydrolase [Patescibacteria group bacterium]
MDLKNIKGFLIDMDGTTYLSHRLLPGAKDFLDFLHRNKKPYLFFTNNPSSSVKDYVKKFHELGLTQVKEKNIITSGQATIEYLKSHKINKIYLLATPSYEAEIKKAKIKLTDRNPQAVILSFDKTLTYKKLETAAHLLANKKIKYIATNPDLVCPTINGPIPDCGAIAALLEKATGRIPLYIGKPNKGMVLAAAKRLGLKPETMAIIGDRLYTDMKMAINHKLTSILVLSGETKKSDLQKSDLEPDYVFENLRELLTKLK